MGPQGWANVCHSLGTTGLPEGGGREWGEWVMEDEGRRRRLRKEGRKETYCNLMYGIALGGGKGNREVRGSER